MGINKNHIAIGLGAAALLCGLSKSPDGSKGEGVKPSKVSEPISKKQRDIGVDLRSIIDALAEDAEDDEEHGELTVEVPVGEDGNIPADFNYYRAIRDCIESSGELKCLGGHHQYQSCYGVDPEDARVPFYVEWGYMATSGSQITAPFHIDGVVEVEDNDQIYEYDSHRAEESRDQLNQLCRDAVQKYLDSREFDTEDYSDMVINAPYDLFDLQDEFFEIAGQSDFEIVDEGGGYQIMWLNGEKVEVTYNFEVSRILPTDEYDWEPFVEVKIGERDYFHNFASADEALEFIWNAE